MYPGLHDQDSVSRMYPVCIRKGILILCILSVFQLYPMCIPVATSGYSILPVSQCVFLKYLTFMYSDRILDVSHAYLHGHFRIQYPTGIPVCILKVRYPTLMYFDSILDVSC